MKQFFKTYAFCIYVCIAIGWIGGSIMYDYISYKNGQIDALKGNQKYEQQIQYTFKGSDIINTDTIYVKINK